MPDAGPRPVDLAEWDVTPVWPDAKIVVPRTALAALVDCARVLRLAYEAMNHLGDKLNAMDEAEAADVEQYGPTWEAVEKALAAVVDTTAPGAGGSG